MKIIIFLLLLTTNAFAFDICSLETSEDFENAIAAKAGVLNRTSVNHGSFSKTEQELILRTIRLQSWLATATMPEALEMFADMNEYRRVPGDQAGEILYYTLFSTAGNKQVILVRYWPGENEYGAFFEVKGSGNVKLLATLNDSDIYCE